MATSNDIPMTPEPWNNNPNGYVYHQTKLRELAKWLESIDETFDLPEEREGWDLGIDIITRGSRIDLKSCGLDSYGRSLTWRSKHYRGRRAPVYRETLTDYFVHPTDGPPSEWIVAPVKALRTSKYGYAPYYFQHETITMASFIKTPLKEVSV